MKSVISESLFLQMMKSMMIMGGFEGFLELPEKLLRLNYIEYIEIFTKLAEMEWMELFEAKKKDTVVMKVEIDRVDAEIYEMVVDFCGLTVLNIKENKLLEF